MEEEAHVALVGDEEPPSRPPSSRRNDKNTAVPPGKNVTRDNSNDAVVAAPARGGFQASAPSTFSGERGGTADDEELVRELMAVSMKSNATDQLAGGEDKDNADTIEEEEAVAIDYTNADKKPNIDLPPGWLCVWSKSQKRWYFFDTRKNFSVWKWPPPQD